MENERSQSWMENAGRGRGWIPSVRWGSGVKYDTFSNNENLL